MLFQHEDFESVYEEMYPILVRHYLEISANQDIPLSVNYKAYAGMAKKGTFKTYTARTDDGVLIGYACFFVNHNLHYQESLQAVQDVVYIDKQHRGFGQSFISWCDAQLKNLGVQVVYQHVKEAHNWGHMLERIGYNKVESIWSKRLDKELV